MSSGLFQAVVECRYLHAKFLMDGGVSIDSKNTRGENALIGALRWIPHRQRRLRMVRWLLFLGADIGECDVQTERDAILWSAFLNRTDELKFMLKNHEVDINFRHADIHGRSALHYAVLHNNEYVVLWLTKRFCKYRMSVDITDNYKLTPYIMAAELGYEGCARILAEIGEASLTQTQTTFFSFSHIWVGLEDWLDPRYCIIASKPIERSLLLNSNTKQAKSKVTFASSSLGDFTEFRPPTSNTVKSDTAKSSKKQSKYGSVSRKGMRVKKTLGSKSCEVLSTPDSSLCISPDLAHQKKTFKTQSTQSNPETGRFLPDITAVSNIHANKKPAPPNSASFKRKTMPLIFDLYAEQICHSYRAPARKAVIVAPPPSSPPAKKQEKSPAISFGTLGKVTKFAALMKMKKRANQAAKKINVA